MLVPGISVLGRYSLPPVSSMSHSMLLLVSEEFIFSPGEHGSNLPDTKPLLTIYQVYPLRSLGHWHSS